MPRNIPSQVAKNRRDVERINGEFIAVPSRLQENLRFLRNTIEVQVDLKVYTRPLNASLISGHPDGGAHGSGHGVSGDQRGAWSEVVSAASTHQWTEDGRQALRDSLDGQAGGSIAATSVGTGSASASVSDTTLVARTGGTYAYGVKDAAETVRARSHYHFSEYGDGQPDPQEFGMESTDGRLLARCTSSSAVATSSEEELRVDISATMVGKGAGNSVVTTDGETAAADSIQLPSTTVGFQEIAWGTGSPSSSTTTSLSKSATALDNEVFRKSAERNLGLESIEVSAPQFEHEPSGQPYDYTEAGVFDNQGRLAWLVEFDAFTKDSDTRFTTNVGFRLL